MDFDVKSLIDDVDKFVEFYQGTSKVNDEDQIPQGSPGEKVAQTAIKFAENPRVTGAHCWDWVDKIYKLAGAKPSRVFQNLNYTGKDCGNSCAPNNLVNQLQPGDWLYINNKNPYDDHGNHSVIFLSWRSPGSLANIASCWKSGTPGKLHVDDLSKNKVTHISRAA